MNKQIDLSSLPRKGKLIDWKNSVGCKCHFIYKDTKGDIEIIKYIPNTHPMIEISFNNYNYTISTSSFTQCNLGMALKYLTNDYRFKIGEIIPSQTGSLQIINQERRRDKNGHPWKWHKIKCLDCGEERWVNESYLNNYTPNCLNCNENIHNLQIGINDITTLAAWAVPFFPGGAPQAQQYQIGSGKKLIFKCPICGQLAKHSIAIRDLIKTHSIGCQCDGKMSFPELVIFNLLNQFNITFYTQVTNTILPWANTKRYDFYLPELNCIIETHGKQHYAQSKLKGRTLEEEQLNDKQKKENALNNGIQNYFEINCSESDINFILSSCEASGLLSFLSINRNDINFENLYYNQLHDQIEQCKKILENNPNIYYSDLKRELKLEHSYDLDRILGILQKTVKTNHQFGVTVYYDNKLLKTFPSIAAFKRESKGKEYYLSFQTLKKYIQEKIIYKNHYTYRLED